MARQQSEIADIFSEWSYHSADTGNAVDPHGQLSIEH